MSSGPGQVVVLGRAQEAEAVRQALEHALGEDQARGLGLRLQDLEDQLLLAQAGRALDAEVLGDLRELGDRHLLERPDVEHLLRPYRRPFSPCGGAWFLRRRRAAAPGLFRRSSAFSLRCLLLLRRDLPREKFCDAISRVHGRPPLFARRRPRPRPVLESEHSAISLQSPCPLASLHVRRSWSPRRRAERRAREVLARLLVERRRADPARRPGARPGGARAAAADSRR